MKGYTIVVILCLLFYRASCIVRYAETATKSSLTEERLNWAAFEGNSKQFAGVKNSDVNVENYRPEQKPISSTIYNQQQTSPPQQFSNENNVAPSWDGENCPPKTTGLFPVQTDCRQFLNCFKGRGYVQSCAPGTLFNPNSLECDFPAKVQCLNGNPSKIDSSFVHKNPGQDFDSNAAQTSEQDRVFGSNANQHQPQFAGQQRPQFTSRYQPQSTDQYQPQSTNQYQPQSTNQYQPQPTNPLPGSQFVVKEQGLNIDGNHPQRFGPVTPTNNNGLQAVNGYGQPNAGVQPQQLGPANHNRNFASQNTPDVLNPGPVNSNVNYHPGSVSQQYPQQQQVKQNVNQHPPRINSNNGYANQGQEPVPDYNGQSNFEGSQFLLDQNNYGTPNNNNYGGAPGNHGNVQQTPQSTYLTEQEQINRQKLIKYRKPSVTENPKPASNINPTSWMKDQLKGRKGPGQNSYPNGYTNEQSTHEEFQTPNKPASAFDLDNGQRVGHSEPINIQSTYDQSADGSQGHVRVDYGQQPFVNGHGYNSNPSPGYWAPPQSVQQPQPPRVFHQTPQDGLHTNGHPRANKEFKIVVPNISNPIDNGGEQFIAWSDSPQPQPNSRIQSKDSTSDRGYPAKTRSQQYPADRRNDNVVGATTTQNRNYNPPATADNNGRSSASDAVSKCPDGFSGIKPHPTDCSKFLSCSFGRTFEMVCGPGTLFNPTISVCDYPYNVQCNRIVAVQTTTTERADYGYASLPVELTTEPDGYYVSPTDLRQNFVPDTGIGNSESSVPVTENQSSSTEPEPLTESEPLEDESRAVLETLPVENRQLKILRNPTSIDLPDNFLPNITSDDTRVSPKVVDNRKENIAVRIDLKPNSTQSIRLRGGPKFTEGFLQVQDKPFQWGVVCDEPNSWTIEKADIVCKQLGFKRGAEQTWQGLTVTTDNPTRLLRNIGVTKVSCNGQESVFHNCKLQNNKTCNVERDAVWVKCRRNSGSECQPEEVSYDGKCYKLFIPVSEKQSKPVQDLGYSKAEALEHCQKRGGKLLDIGSQKENDFISEWLSRQNAEGPILTSGVGVSLLGSPIWIWEGTENPFVYQNWWPGWEFKKIASPNIKSNRALCIVLQKSFPCPSNPNSTKLCDSEYYHWETIDCGTKTDRLPYICERDIDDIGCVNGAGSSYIGSANTTASGNACLSWEDQSALVAMKYRVSEKTRKIFLSKHNKCRNPDGTDLQPWCYVRTSMGIVRSEFCDIPVCNSAATPLLRASPLIEKSKCDAGYFECQPNECISQAWVCDNQADCRNGMDEKNCSNVLENFIKTPEARLTNREAEKWLHITAHTCANRCMQADGFICQSFSHNEIDQTCILNERTKYDNSTILESDKDWNYYETDNALCIGKFICENGNCIDKSKECDGHNDCGDRSDEIKCTGAMMGYEIRLAGGNSSNEGRVEVKVLGEWGVICDDQFDLREANVICRELGFPSSVVVKSNSYFGVPNRTRFVLDNLNCNGNENSLYSCQFKEWGVHDCNAQESAGVVCRVAGGKACTDEEFECKSGECIPSRFLCDAYTDCTDGSDELPERCNSPLEIRLVGGRERRAGMEGRVEVRRFGVWGTVCDDDFSMNEALVICNNLGFKGTAEFKREAAFGPGSGKIWLDQLKCAGNETSLDRCLHAKWGEHNCKHAEDVSVVCHSDRKKTNDSETTAAKIVIPTKKILKELLPNMCGKRLVRKSASVVQQRIALGFSSDRGDHPWQASIRMRTLAGETEHACGAVIISKHHVLTAAHCVRDLDKDVYYVRVGDFNTDIVEDSEQDIYIDEIYSHEDFEGSIRLNNDISVIKLKTTDAGIKFNQYVQPICLPTKNTKLKPGSNCTITGWGSDGTIGSGYAKSMRLATVPIIDTKICKAEYVYGNSSISNGMFCAGNLDGGPDACQGDSGGPLVCSTDLGETVMGITSWGNGCGRANSPGVYTNVQNYEEWLLKTLLRSAQFEVQKQG